MRINVHAGHNRDGRVGCGAIGFLKESTEARVVNDLVVKRLRALGHEVFDCTVDDAISVTENLRQIVAKCNSNTVDLDISIHFNVAVNDQKGDGKTTGVEAYVYNPEGAAVPYARSIVNAISELGFTNRGVKYNSNLYVLKNTNSPAVLIECCFIDDKDDVELYNSNDMANAIVYGITGIKAAVLEEVSEDVPSKEETTVGNPKSLYRVQVGAYSVKENAERMKEKLKTDGYDAIIVKV